MTLVAENIPAAAIFDAPPRGVKLEHLLALEYSHAPRAFHSTALELKVFDILLNGPQTAERVADAAGCQPTMMRCLLDALGSLGWVENGHGRYRLTPTARFFNGSWGLRKSPVQPDAFWGRFLHMLRDGRIDPWPQGGAADWTDFAVQRHMALRAFAGEFHRTQELLKEAGVFEGARSLLDVAAGHAIFAIGFKRSQPALNVTILDLPAVVPLAQGFIEAYGLTGEIEVIAADVHADGLTGRYDIVFASNFGRRGGGFVWLCKMAYDALNEGGVFVYKDIVPHRHWSEAFHPLAHHMRIAISRGDPRLFEDLPPTAEEARTIMKQTGFSRTQFLGWIRRWSSIAAGWK